MNTASHAFRVGVLLLVCVTPALGQVTPPEDRDADVLAADLAYAEGDVDVERGGGREPGSEVSYLEDGDRVVTREGRAEIVFSDGSVLHLDRDTRLDLLSPDRFRLLHGRIAFRTSTATRAPYVVDTPAGTVSLFERGEFGITSDSSGKRLVITASRGEAEVDYDGGRALVRTGEMASFDGPRAHARYARFNTARWDGFDRWVDGRVNGYTRAASSARLPYELRPYGPVFDQHGVWSHEPEYGAVWRPSVAAAGWRPYYNGYWRTTRHGWTWFGRDAWAWPTHHYGRWGLRGTTWFWIPTRVWGPAWVSWAYAPNYVSWSPLGWHGGPVVSLSIISGSRGIDPWRAWTVVPRGYLGRREPVRTWAVPPARVPRRERDTFVVDPGAAPARRAEFAVPRRDDAGSGPGREDRRFDGTGDRRWGGGRAPRESPAPMPAPRVYTTPWAIDRPSRDANPSPSESGRERRVGPPSRGARGGEPPESVIAPRPTRRGSDGIRQDAAAGEPAERPRGRGAIRRSAPDRGEPMPPPPGDAGAPRGEREGAPPRGGERRRPPG